MVENNLPTNRLAIISFVFALLTFFSFCVGLAPFLLGSSLICYPMAFLFGAIALISGAIALIQIRRSGEAGLWMAISGFTLGGLLIFATLCAIMLTVSALVAAIAQSLNIPLSTPQAP